MGDYDIPAVIEYVLQQTGYPKLAYIGHSVGTTQLFYAMVKNNDYFKERISVFVALAPSLEMSHMTSPIVTLMVKNDFLIASIYRTLGIGEMFPTDLVSSRFQSVACNFIPQLCQLGISFLTDSDKTINDDEAVQAFISHYPAGASVNAMLHVGQLVASGKF